MPQRNRNNTLVYTKCSGQFCDKMEAWAWNNPVSVVKVKVKCSRYSPVVAQMVGRGITLLFQDHSTRRGWVGSSTLRPYFTPGKEPVPILQEAGWASGPIWKGRKARPPPGFDPLTDQPVVSHYTDWATQSTSIGSTSIQCYVTFTLFYFSYLWPASFTSTALTPNTADCI
jgi:hypothetical protein